MPAVRPTPPKEQTPTVIRAKFGDSDHFGAMVSPSAQASFARHPEKAVGGNYPTLAEIVGAYGKDYDVEWLVPQLYDLSEFTGAKNLTEKQQEMLARMIAAEYPGLKVTELLLFFHRFKTGCYGRFYGTVDPIVVMTALQEFMKDRAELKAKCADDIAGQWRQWAEGRVPACLEAIRSQFGLEAGQLYVGEVNGYQRKVRFSTDSGDVFLALTADGNARRITAIARQHLGDDTRIVVWLNCSGGRGVILNDIKE